MIWRVMLSTFSDTGHGSIGCERNPAPLDDADGKHPIMDTGLGHLFGPILSVQMSKPSTALISSQGIPFASSLGYHLQ